MVGFLIDAAVKIAEEHRNDFPEDEWYEIDENWDVNLYELDGVKKCAIHHVMNGSTVSEPLVVIDLSEMWK